MKRIALAFSICIILLMLTEFASAQSGSRNSPRRTNRTPSIEQTRLIQQQTLARQHAAKYARRLEALRRLASNRNGSENVRSYSAAFKEAKKEFMAIKRKSILVSGRRLEQLFVLKSDDVNRTKRSIRWPDILLEDEHKELADTIESGLMHRELSTAEVHRLLGELSVQLEERVISETIRIKDYAVAKRFVAGLANEAEL